VEVKLDGVGKALSLAEANRGRLYTAWIAKSAVLCLGIQDPTHIDIGYVLILAGDRVPALSIVDVSDISGPRVSVEGALLVRPLPDDSALPFARLYGVPVFGALAITEGHIWLVREHPRAAMHNWYIDLTSGIVSVNRPEGAFYLTRWELVQRLDEDRESTLARVPPDEGWPSQ
jgi:hypothetical protein